MWIDNTTVQTTRFAAATWKGRQQADCLHRCRTAPAARATYERTVATARAQLGEDAFATAWAAGTALSLDQTIAEAFAMSDAL